MPLKRTEHWATREFHDFLVRRAEQPFAWGSNDCCLFPADAIQAFTGLDLAAAFRGKYDSQETALAAIHEIAGGTTVGDAVAWCAAQQGLPERPFPRYAQRGDLVTLRNGDGSEIAGIVGLTGHLLTVDRGGLVEFPITSIRRAWRV